MVNYIVHKRGLRVKVSEQAHGVKKFMKFGTSSGVLRIFVCILVLGIVAQAQPSQLNVSSGSGDGAFRGAPIKDVWADPNPTGFVFDRWIGDAHLLRDRFDWHTRVKTGAKNINVTAVYRPASAWSPTALEAVGTSEMRYYFPPNPVGVIFHFHGSGGSANGLFQSTEQRVFAADAVADGYAVVTLSSEDRVNRQWNPALPPNNPDIVNVQTAINTLTQRGLITAGMPIYATGISNGGAFAPRVSLALNFRGTAIYIASGTANIMTQTTVPTIWCLNQNDTGIGQSGIQQSLSNYDNLIGRGIRAQHNILMPSPVYPERFWRVPGLTASDSVTIYNSLKANGILDRLDYQIQSPFTSGWQNFVPPQYNSYLGEILAQLEICWTEHEFQSDHNRRVLNFFTSLR